MMANPFFLLSIFISSMFVFLATAFIVAAFLKIFRIQKHRIRSTLMLLPFVHLVVDLFLNRYRFADWINPLSCASCVQKLFLQIFFPNLKAHLAQQQISLIDYLGAGHDYMIFSSVFLLFMAASLFFVLKKMAQAFFLMRSLHAIARNSNLYQRPITSTSLDQALKKHKVRIYTSAEIQVPLTVYPKIVIIPQNMIHVFSEQECEAVITHEWGHIQYQDSITRFLCHSVAAFFWWVPMQFWIKKIEQEQELACDQSVLKYGISGDSLASALCMVARQLKTHEALCYFRGGEPCVLLRVQHILGLKIQDQKALLGMHVFGLTAGGLLLLACVIMSN